MVWGMGTLKSITGIWKAADRGLLVRLAWAYSVDGGNRGVLHVLKGEVPTISSLMLAPVLPTRNCKFACVDQLQKQNGYYTFRNVVEYYKSPSGDYVNQELGFRRGEVK